MISLEGDTMAPQLLTDEHDPMAGAANIVDCMLVFACGLMLALISFWNLDLPDIREMTELETDSEIMDVKQTEDSLSVNGQFFEELGMVYRDPQTDKLYLLEEEENTGSGKAGE